MAEHELNFDDLETQNPEEVERLARDRLHTIESAILGRRLDKIVLGENFPGAQQLATDEETKKQLKSIITNAQKNAQTRPSDEKEQNDGE